MYKINDMKKFAVLCFVIAGVLFSGKADAQILKLGVDGLLFGEDSTHTKDVVSAHSQVSVKKKKKNKVYVSGGFFSSSSVRSVEYGWNMVNREDSGDFFDLYNWGSNQITVNPIGMSATNKWGTFGLSMAIGVRVNNYMFYDDITIGKDGGSVYPVPLEGKVKKSRFTTAAIHIPLELTVGKPSNLALSVGGFADINFNSHTKVKYAKGPKAKEHRFPVNFLQAGLSAKIIFNSISFYCNWCPAGIFEDGKGPKMQVWSFGIGIL